VIVLSILMNSVTVRELLPQTNHALAPGTNDTYTRACVFLKWLKMVLILFSAFGSILEA
jgi:hypothetical protein